ncbi:MAG TPA: flagellar basal body L-ring protein FlgH [Paucimonas sp.]|nr:flagellar basal body L-ring protein FlgH [Paucimonas sp.]
MAIRHQIGLVAALCCTVPVAAESLYDAGSFRAMVSDKRAHRIGDSLTVLIYENSSATTRADTSTHRKNNVGVRAFADGSDHAAGIGLSNDFDGGGTVQRSGRLLAQITASVTGIAPNGDLLITGEQMLEINADKQHIRVEGRVRTLDISDANTVLSSRLADARISYLGAGELTDSQRRGWLTKILTWLGL